MNKCNNHPITIPGYNKDLKTLAEAVENLRYDALSEFLGYLGDALFKRSQADQKAGKLKLARALGKADGCVLSTEEYIDKAWKICKPYMDENDS